MGMFNYRDFDSKQVMQNALLLFSHLGESMAPSIPMDTSFAEYNKDGAWRELMPSDLGDNSKIMWDPIIKCYRGETLLLWGTQSNVLGKYDDSGKLVSIGITFWGMGSQTGASNMLIDSVSDAIATGSYILNSNLSMDDFTHDAFNNLLTAIAQLAKDNGLTGRDVNIIGGSMGGMCVNSMAAGSALGYWDGFYEDAAFIACMSPTQNTLDDKVLNIGLENDPVFRVLEGSKIGNLLETLFVHDAPKETCTNNVVAFNDYYSNRGNVSILDFANSWSNGHGGSWYEKVMTKIFESDFYDFTNINSTTIVSCLSDEARATTWVSDLNHAALRHTGPTFILGSDQDDLIQGGKGIDYLEGNDGNDTFRDQGGYNLIDGGDGIDTYDTQDHFDYKSWTRDAFGMTWVRDKEGNVSLLNNVEQIKGGYAGWFGIGWNEINGTFTDDGIAFTYAGKNGFKAYSETAQGDIYKGTEVIAQAAAKGESGFLFGGFGNDMLTGTASDEVFFAHEGNDILYLGGGKDVVMTLGENFGHDQIYQFGQDDKLVFMLNSKMETDTSILDYMVVAGDDIVFIFDDNNSVTLVGGASSDLSNDQFICG